ncbi:putative nicotinate phosphoribosyltransferase [compost metagenome]
MLGYQFGTIVNAKGFKDLPSSVGTIYGDSINPKLFDEILSRLADKGYSSNCVVVGIGSFSYQYMTRDTLGSAVKATFGVVDGVGRGILKDPKTGDGHKKSAFGILSVMDTARPGQSEQLELMDGEVDIPAEAIFSGNFDTGLLTPVFRNGKLLKFQTLSEIRQRLNSWDDRIPGL